MGFERTKLMNANMLAYFVLPPTGDTGLPGLASLAMALGIVIIMAALAILRRNKRKK